VLLPVTGLALLWRERARLGLALDDHRERRSDAVDLLDSLALLYGRSLGRAEVRALLKTGDARAVGRTQSKSRRINATR
jgi:hypothetical protein